MSVVGKKIYFTVAPHWVHGLKLQKAQDWKVASYGMHGLKRTYLLLFIIEIRKVCSQLIWLQIFFLQFFKNFPKSFDDFLKGARYILKG